MNCARSAPLDRGHFLLEKCVLSSPNAKFSPLRGPESALRAARYAGRATRAGVLRTAREAGGRTCGPILLMKPRRERGLSLSYIITRVAPHMDSPVSSSWLKKHVRYLIPPSLPHPPVAKTYLPEPTAEDALGSEPAPA